MKSIRGDQGRLDRPLGPDDTQETSIVPSAPVAAAEAPGRRRRRRLLVGALAALLAAGAGIGTWLGTKGGSPHRTTGFVVATRTVRVTAGTMAQSVATSGTIQPAQTADLNFAVSGRVTAVDASVGDMVKAGQVLATIAPTALKAQLAAAQSSLSSDQSKLAADQASGAGTSQVAADEATIVAAQTQLTTAKKSLADATLVSSITGEVSTVNLTVGEQVSGSGNAGSSSSPTRLFGPGSGTNTGGGQVTVVTPNRFIVGCTVDDTEVAQLSDGDRVIVDQTGTPVSAPGTVTFVGLVPSGTGIPSYPVTVTLTGTPSDIYAGTNARLTIIVKRLNHVVQVPTPAVSYRGARASVRVKEPGGAVVAQQVTVGTTINGETEITKGLTAGQRVVERVETYRGSPPAGRRSGTSKSVHRITTGFVGVGPSSGPIEVPGG